MGNVNQIASAAPNMGGMVHDFVTAMQENDFNKVYEIISNDEFDVNQIGHSHWTPLTTAISEEYKGLEYKWIKFLLDVGANPNYVSRTDYETPLTWAVKRGDEAIVELLLQNDAIELFRYYDKCSALHDALKSGKSKIADLLQQYDFDPESTEEKMKKVQPSDELPEHIGGNERLLRKVVCILDKGRGLNEFSDVFASAGVFPELDPLIQSLLENWHPWDTPLIRACQEGHSGAAKLLIQCGACLTINKNEPLKLAKENGHDDIVKMLLEAKEQQVQVFREFAANEGVQLDDDISVAFGFAENAPRNYHPTTFSGIGGETERFLDEEIEDDVCCSSSSCIIL